jgi:creatinine amidohydrolase/Fe(II)-dependent formamide hydrolase-like protein
MLYLRQDLVRTDRLDVFPFGKLAVEALSGGEVHFVRPWHRYVPAGAGGDVRQASAEKGRQIIEGSAEQLAELLVQLSQAPWSDTFPYKP